MSFMGDPRAGASYMGTPGAGASFMDRPTPSGQNRQSIQDVIQQVLNLIAQGGMTGDLAGGGGLAAPTPTATPPSGATSPLGMGGGGTPESLLLGGGQSPPGAAAPPPPVLPSSAQGPPVGANMLSNPLDAVKAAISNVTGIGKPNPNLTSPLVAHAGPEPIPVGGLYVSGPTAPGPTGTGAGQPNVVSQTVTGGAPRNSAEQTNNPLNARASLPDLTGSGLLNRIGNEGVQQQYMEKPLFAVQDIMRDLGANPSNNIYAQFGVDRWAPIFSSLGSLAQAGAAEADKPAAYGNFLKSWASGADVSPLLKTVIQQALQPGDKGQQQRDVLKSLGPEQIARIISADIGESPLNAAARQRAMENAQIEAMRKAQGKAMEGNVADDDQRAWLEYLLGNLR